MDRCSALNRDPTEEGTVTRAEDRRIRARKIVSEDLKKLILPDTCSTEFADPNDLLNFVLVIQPNDGYYCGGSFRFSFQISDEYPISAPTIKCLSKIFHPNIDARGNVGLNMVLREHWSAAFTIESIVYGLLNLLVEPDPEDALNTEAGNLLVRDATKFARKVISFMKPRKNKKK